MRSRAPGGATRQARPVTTPQTAHSLTRESSAGRPSRFIAHRATPTRQVRVRHSRPGLVSPADSAPASHAALRGASYLVEIEAGEFRPGRQPKFREHVP